MSNIGPQRAIPSSPAKINAEVQQVTNELNQLKRAIWFLPEDDNDVGTTKEAVEEAERQMRQIMSLLRKANEDENGHSDSTPGIREKILYRPMRSIFKCFGAKNRKK